MQLRDLQSCFQRFLLAEDTSIERHVIDTPQAPAAVRLGIYADAYRSRLVEALESNFPVLAELLGASDFERLGSAYVRAHDSTCFTVRYYGDRLAQFLASDSRYASIPVLTELARWEWAMAIVFDAADVPPIDASALAAVLPEEWAYLQLRLSPSVQLLDLAWNVADIWKAVTDETERPQATLLEQPATWMLWREKLQIYFRSLSTTEAAVLEAARSGQSFGDLCLLLSELVGPEQAAGRAAGYLRQWLQAGLIVTASVTQ
jgi:hypothetical protein